MAAMFEKNLTAMVKGIRANRGKETEYIHACIQEIQKEVTSTNLSVKSQAVLKLAYLTMLGYDMTWSTFAVVEVMSAGRFSIKRPGYLASSMSFTDGTDVGLLTINLFKKDFGSKSQYEAGMAISCLSSICTPEICRDILTDLTTLLSSSRAYLRKKTVLCLYRVFLKDPPALRTCFPRLKERLADEDQGVLTATVNTFLELARKNAKNYLSLVPQLYHILVNTTNNWLSIKLLKVFQLLCPLESRLPAKMVEPLTNLLNTTKAQSVEFETIRCVVRVMPEGTALMALAIEKLQTFLNSSDRNLRFLALDLFREILEKVSVKDSINVPDLHAKVLQSIEESDTTARKIALQLLDSIVTPASFVDTVKKLMEFSKNSCSPDEFIGTILRMGARDRYALIEDFAWYLIVLADMARSIDSAHAHLVAEQFVDITVRVEGVRPYAVNLALSLIDGTLYQSDSGAAGEGTSTSASAVNKEGVLEVSAAMAGGCAWLLGEFHEAFEGAAEAIEASYIRAAKAMLSPKRISSLEPSIQAQCVWAATKLYIGSASRIPAGGSVLSELHDILTSSLKDFIQSTHVDVSERATLSYHLVKHFKADAAQAAAGARLFQERLLPVQPEAQKQVPIPDGLDLDGPFFAADPQPEERFVPVRADPTDPYALAATYKDDLGFLAARDSSEQVAQASAPAPPANSMFYLQSKDSATGGAVSDGQVADGRAGSSGAPDAKVDPLEQMRERLLAQRASGGPKYQVMRDELSAPGGGSTAGIAPAITTSAAAVAGTMALPVPAEKELTELQGRLWSPCFSDDNIGLYMCVRSKNVKKMQLRIDLRCEKVTEVAGAVVSNVRLQPPAAVPVQEADKDGAVVLVPGELQDRSGKTKANLSLAPFLCPVNERLSCQVLYDIASGGEEACSQSKDMELVLPSTTFLSPAPMSEDDIASYIACSGEQLLSTKHTLSSNQPGRSADELAAMLPGIVGRCAGLCNFHGLQQRVTAGAAEGKPQGQKFLLVAQAAAPSDAPASALGQEPLPANSRVISLCSFLTRENNLDVRLTVKSLRKDISEDIGNQLALVLTELLEGRLRSDVS